MIFFLSENFLGDKKNLIYSECVHILYLPVYILGHVIMKSP